MDKQWWQSAVIYQIYPKSFQDTNGDGIGDIQGIIQHLDYLKELSVDAIWISPIYKSPQVDSGYDISDYQDIDPIFGNMNDMDQLIKEAKKRNICIIMDLVLNHCSDQHKWFIEAKKSKNNPYHDYFIWRDGVKGTPPNEMMAYFGGSAWEWVPELGQYYFHQFTPQQPDLNWHNPEVREELYSMIRWWMNKGIGGFRLDVIDLIAKVPDLKIAENGPLLHDYVRELSKNTFQTGKNIVTVGEAGNTGVEGALLFSNPDGSELSMVFQFEHMDMDHNKVNQINWMIDFDLVKLKKILSKWQNQLENRGWNSLFLENHDQPRIVSRWGNDKEYREASAKMFAVMLHGMQGTPFIYQGEELGMTNYPFKSIDECADVAAINLHERMLKAGYSNEDAIELIRKDGRDNARTPMQWNTNFSAGFTEGTPWLAVNPNYTEINAEEQINNPNSIYHFYRKLIRLRKEYSIFTDGSYRLLDAENPDSYSYIRETKNDEMYVVCSFSDKVIPLDIPETFRNDAKVLIANYEINTDKELQPFEARIYYRKK